MELTRKVILVLAIAAVAAVTVLPCSADEKNEKDIWTELTRKMKKTSGLRMDREDQEGDQDRGPDEGRGRDGVQEDSSQQMRKLTAL
jgi:hypothetical protein